MKSALLILNPVEIHDTEKINVINRLQNRLASASHAGNVVVIAGKPQFAGSFFPVDTWWVNRIIRPRGISAFSDAGLEEYLHSVEVGTVYVTGYAPEFGLLDTVRDALDRRFNVTIILDACVWSESAYTDSAVMVLTRQTGKRAKTCHSNELLQRERTGT